jgi:hypothetical protein
VSSFPSFHIFYSLPANDVMVFIPQLIMTGVAVLVVDRLGRRPLLIGGVSGIVSLHSSRSSISWQSVSFLVEKKYKYLHGECSYGYWTYLLMQTVSLFLLSSYYTLLKDASYVAVIALLLYVGCYQVFSLPCTLLK